MFFVQPQIHPVKCRSAAISRTAKLFNRVKFNNLWRAISSLFGKPDLKSLTQKLSSYFPDKQLIFTDMGRSAFKVIIEKFNLQNSEILFPAYICDIFEPILKQYNIKPIFLDIDLKTFHIRIDEIKKKITPRSKAILVCHTYGLPIDVSKIREIVGNNIFIIEDCAHSFGASPHDGGFVGNLGDVSFFSLYKQFPTLRGGLLVCPKDWEVHLPKTFFNFRDFISFLNCFAFFAFFFKKFGARVAPKMVRKEKLPKPAKLNRISLNLFSFFLNDFEESLQRRKELALFFQTELKKLGFEVQESKDNVFCRFSTLVPKNLEAKRDKIFQELKKQRVFCNRMWHTPVILNKQAQKEYQINLEEFSNTIEAAKRIINFPLQNYYTKKDIEKMIKAIKNILEKL
jgi:dTDP-4-amino-4,6-dideoxygalactose transaminase